MMQLALFFISHIKLVFVYGGIILLEKCAVYVSNLALWNQTKAIRTVVQVIHTTD